MKISSNTFLIIGMAAFALWACKKDEVKVIAKTGQPGTLAASQTTLVLNSANANDTIQAFSWSGTDYGFKAAVRYTLQLAKGGTNFASPTEVNMGSGTTKKYTTAEFNQLALILGLAPGSAGQIQARVKSSISDSIPAVYSNVVTINTTPYLVIINYPSLYVPGDYQGWNPGSAEKIASKTNNGQYEGYVNFPTGGTLQFKFTSDPDWNHSIYGAATTTVSGNSVSGTLKSPGDNLTVPSAGYYRLKANTTALTWSAVKTQWGLIGDATGSWDVDKDMTYDAAAKTWTITTNLVVGKIKFRANDAWDINYGDNGADLSLEEGGADIPITAAGNYTVVLDLSVPGNYTYRIRKN
ncbi:MAG: SusE domain-containing protein [Bacteroidota bacterium]|nr:SusE domain-containing protein [Flavisolibacter sp.]MDQ3842865.1 SusE domain-containing protein [Bacteroidota bacterium]